MCWSPTLFDAAFTLTVHNRHVRPGGWVEQVELSSIISSDDGTIPPGSVFERWTDIWGQVGDRLGITFRTAEVSRAAIEEAGFVDVTERVIKVPLGTWPKDRKLKAWGEWYRFFALEGLEGFALRSLTDVLGVSCSYVVPGMDLNKLTIIMRYSGPMRKPSFCWRRCEGISWIAGSTLITRCGRPSLPSSP